MDLPLVSVICLCFNHERFVREAVESVVRQTYPNLQIIIVDDGSSDNSVLEINRLVKQYPQISFLPLKENLGNTKAFNKGLAIAKGDYIVDFATDDVFLPERIEKQVKLFSFLDDTYGVIFTDAIYIDEHGVELKSHYDYLFSKGLLTNISEGDVYQHVLQTYFISSPSMLVKREVFNDLNGYDENLTYEDFDFWVRSSRYYKYAYLPEELTKVRISKKSMSTRWYKRGDKQLYSTYIVCKKAFDLNRSPEENYALINRVRYELRQSVFSQNYVEAELFYKLLKKLQTPTWIDDLLVSVNRMRLPLSFFRSLYHRIRYN